MRSKYGTLELSKFYIKLLDTILLDVKKFGQLSDGHFDCRIFSDTIIFYTKTSSVPSFMMLLVASQNILKYGFCVGNTPLRGAVGFGDLFVENGIFLGSAVEDAYEGEQSQVWSGCMLTQATSDFVETNNYINGYENLVKAHTPHAKNLLNLLVEYDIPLQKASRIKEYSRKKGLAVDWTKTIDIVGVDKTFLPTTKDHPKRIIQNTMDFENWARARNAL